MQEAKQHKPQGAITKDSPVGKSTEKAPSPTKNAIPALSSDILESPVGNRSFEEGGSGKISVTLPTINSETTPEVMTKMRIPPKVEQNFAVNPSKKGVTLSVETQGGGNGSVLINGANTLALTEAGEQNIKLLGVDQTAPGNADKLKLVAKKGNTVINSSNNFSVAAIPQDWTLTSSLTSTNESKKGLIVSFQFFSDSGDPKDLTEVSVNEQVITSSKEGIFATAKSTNSVSLTYQPIEDSKKKINTEGVDYHRVGVGGMNGPGKMCFDQLQIFKDNRTGASEIPVRNSGFKLTYDVTEIESNPTYKLQMIVTKDGSEITIEGRKATAGLGGPMASDPIKF